MRRLVYRAGRCNGPRNPDHDACNCKAKGCRCDRLAPVTCHPARNRKHCPEGVPQEGFGKRSQLLHGVAGGGGGAEVLSPFPLLFAGMVEPRNNHAATLPIAPTNAVPDACEPS